LQKWLTYKGARSRVGCGKTKFFELVKVGILRAEKVGMTYIVETASVEDYLDAKPSRNSYLEVLYGNNENS